MTDQKTDTQLHATESHPQFEYCETLHDRPKSGSGWHLNTHKRDPRDGYTYWFRTREE